MVFVTLRELRDAAVEGTAASEDDVWAALTRALADFICDDAVLVTPYHERIPVNPTVRVWPERT